MRLAFRNARAGLPAEEVAILQRAIDDFFSLPSLPNALYVAVSFGYADLPVSKAFSVVFDKADPSRTVATQCVLRAVINEWTPIAMDGIPHEHRTVCVFDLPQGIPYLVLTLPEVTYPTGTGIEEKLFLSNQETWELRNRL